MQQDSSPVYLGISAQTQDDNPPPGMVAGVPGKQAGGAGGAYSLQQADKSEARLLTWFPYMCRK